MRTLKMRELIMPIIGLSFFWPFFRRYEFSQMFAGYADAPATTLFSYCIVFGVMTLLVVSVIINREIFEELLQEKRSIILTFSLLGSVGYLLILAAPGSPAALPTYLLGLILIASAYVLLTFGWAISMSTLGGRTAGICLALSFPLSSLLSLTSFLGMGVMYTVTVASTAVSGLIWFFDKHDSWFFAENDSWSSLRELPLGLLLVFFLFIIGGRSVVNFIFLDDLVVPLYERLTTVVLSTVVLLCAARIMYKHSNWSSTFQYSWIFVALIFLVGLSIMIPFNATFAHIGSGAITAELSCFEILLCMNLTAIIADKKLSPILIGGLSFLTFKVIPTFVSRIFVPFVTVRIGLSSNDSTLAILAIITELVLVTAVFIYLGAQTMARTMNVPLVNQSEISRDDLCKQIALEHNLTERELEIMKHIAQGHSMKKIAEQLVISASTIQWHSKNIYRKLGIHTRQDLIDMVDATDR